MYKNDFGTCHNTSRRKVVQEFFSRILVLESDPEVYAFRQMECKVCMRYVSMP